MIQFAAKRQIYNSRQNREQFYFTASWQENKTLFYIFTSLINWCNFRRNLHPTALQGKCYKDDKTGLCSSLSLPLPIRKLTAESRHEKRVTQELKKLVSSEEPPRENCNTSRSSLCKFTKKLHHLINRVRYFPQNLSYFLFTIPKQCLYQCCHQILRIV